MAARVSSFYFFITLGRPAVALSLAALLVAVLGLFAPRFALDVSAESLVLEDDAGLAYYRTIRGRYGSDDYLVVTYRPHGDPFAPANLATVGRLRDELAALEGIESVLSLLDVPLLQSPPVSLGQLQDRVPTLLAPGTDIALARDELATSPLYGQMLVSTDGMTTALYLDLERDGTIPRIEAIVRAVRTVLERYRDEAEIHLAGVPLIVADMIGFIRHDLRVFGGGVLAFIAVLLAVSFRRPRWVLLPVVVCAAAGMAMVGLLGLLGWEVTVVSSSFAAVLLIVTLSLLVHLMVRYQELHQANPASSQTELVEETVRSKFVPSLYTAATTMVAFGSLTVSGLQPVIDFGWIMVIGTGLAFVLVFLIFPAGLALLPAGAPVRRRHDPSGRLAAFAVRLVSGRRRETLVLAALVVIGAGAGIVRLSVESRFIDYFDPDTGISRGMATLDRELGGTTPLDVIIDAPEGVSANGRSEGEGAGFTGRSYWVNLFRRDRVMAIHDYLEALPETGKVLSIATGLRMLESVSPGGSLDDFMLAVVYQRLPAKIKATLFDPYISDDGDELRFAARIFETRRGMDRDALLRRIRNDLTEKFALAPEQVRLTGMAVLYNNVLQSLFRSQALTIGFVFLIIMGMFVALFRSLKVAALAIVPNLAAAALVLGLMGWMAISLDVMTVTIAAITLGIGVDDTVHYTHRFQSEYSVRGDYRAALASSHAGVGRALIYTTVAVALGFSILALSDFVPSRHFGLLTGGAMLFALAANLFLLPALFLVFKPFGTGKKP